MSIPKKIHYCWFGRGPKSELMARCMESWKQYCPEWEIIEWNEDNFDVNFCPYAEKAYREKRYGFLTDAARLKIINENGGVYLDTDVELKCSLDNLLMYDAWFAYGTAKEINTGCGFGAINGHPFVKKMLNKYMSFSETQSFELCTAIDTATFKEEFNNFAGNHNIRQEAEGVVILNDIWRYTIHHYTNTWMTKRQRFVTKMFCILPEGMKKYLKKIKKRK